nr:peptidoglycan binding lysin subgroup,peptidoglycan binding lysin domain [Hymenolepis microstoma]
MSEETWILQKCRVPKNYGTLCENPDNASNYPFIKYTVQTNDTLTSIAVKNNISVGQLKHFNRILLSGDKFIVTGSVLRIPLPAQKNTINYFNNCRKQTPSSPIGDSTERQHQLMIDPLVDAVTSASKSFRLDRPSDHLPERL